jgi:hypothetical protein
VHDRPPELDAQQLSRGVHGVPEPVPPGTTVAVAQPVVQQEDQMAVIGAELAVVQHLAVIGIGAGVEEERGQREGVRVLGLVTFAAAERPGQGRERRDKPMPEVAGVRIGAMFQQQPGGAQGGGLADRRVVAGVCEVEQRLPSVRAALASGERRIILQQGTHGGPVGSAAATWMLERAIPG